MRQGCLFYAQSKSPGAVTRTDPGKNSIEVLDELRSKSPAERATRLSLYSETGALFSIARGTERHALGIVLHTQAAPLLPLSIWLLLLGSH